MRPFETLMISDGEISLCDSARAEKIFLEVKKGVTLHPLSIEGAFPGQLAKAGTTPKLRSKTSNQRTILRPP
jgi:hypothetical protein